MEFHRGRLIDHVHLRVSNLEASKRFYRSVLQALGKGQGIREDEHYFSPPWTPQRSPDLRPLCPPPYRLSQSSSDPRLG